jgi:hypothetical protein
MPFFQKIYEMYANGEGYVCLPVQHKFVTTD